MAKKCKFCNTRIATEDKHSACVDCRSDKRGEDPCVRGKTCKFCESLLKVAIEPHKKDKTVSSEVLPGEVDDSILDEEDPVVAKRTVGSTSRSHAPSMEDTLAAMSAQLTALHRRMDSYEKPSSASSATATVTREAPLNQSVQDHTAKPVAVDDREGQSDGEVVEEDADSLADREPDPNFIEMIQAIKALLEIPDSEAVTFQPPTAFQKKKSGKVTRKQLCTFTPQPDLQEMWQYKHYKASGKDSRGFQESPPLYQGHFLQFQKVNMGHYSTTPMLTTLKSPQAPDSFANLCKDKDKEKVKSPAYINVPIKYFNAQEKAMREVVQILEHVVYYKEAIGVTSDRVKSFIEDAKRSVGPRDLLDRALSNHQMQGRIMSSSGDCSGDGIKPVHDSSVQLLTLA